MTETPSIEMILKDLEKLSEHVKMYNTGAYPAFFLQLHTVLRIQDILDMQLSDLYFWEDGSIKLLPELMYAGETIELDENGRRELAWYALQRIAVCQAQEEALDDWLYRKMLERTSAELGFGENYNVGYLHSLYGYLAIGCGRKTIDETAKEYRVARYYLLNRIFKGRKIQYLEDVIQQVANIEETQE